MREFGVESQHPSCWKKFHLCPRAIGPFRVGLCGDWPSPGVCAGKLEMRSFFSIAGSLRKECPGVFWAKCGFSRSKKFKTKSHPGFCPVLSYDCKSLKFCFGPCPRKSSPLKKETRRPNRINDVPPAVPRESGWRKLASSTDQVLTSDLAMISFIRLDQRGSMGWWFQIFFVFTPIWGRFPFWLIFFKRVETTN